MRSSTLQQWTPAVAAGAILSAVVLIGVVSSEGSSSDNGATESSTTIAQVVTPSSTAPVNKLPLTQTYGRGAAGPEIKLIQDRLIELNFDPGIADGAFGERTQQAVWAFEKLVMGVPRDQVTGKVTPEMWSRMQDPLQILPRRPDSTPDHTEIKKIVHRAAQFGLHDAPPSTQNLAQWGWFRLTDLSDCANALPSSKAVS